MKIQNGCLAAVLFCFYQHEFHLGPTRHQVDSISFRTLRPVVSEEIWHNIMLTDGVTNAGQNEMTKAHLQNEGELKIWYTWSSRCTN